MPINPGWRSIQPRVRGIIRHDLGHVPSWSEGHFVETGLTKALIPAPASIGLTMLPMHAPFSQEYPYTMFPVNRGYRVSGVNSWAGSSKVRRHAHISFRCPLFELFTDMRRNIQLIDEHEDIFPGQVRLAPGQIFEGIIRVRIFFPPENGLDGLGQHRPVGLEIFAQGLFIQDDLGQAFADGLAGYERVGVWNPDVAKDSAVRQIALQT